MAMKDGTSLMRKNEPPESIDYPVVPKKFRVTIDVEATLASGPQGGVLTPSLEDASYTKVLVERLLAQPELVDRLLRCRAVEATRRAGRALEAESGWGKTSEHELLGPIFAELEPDVQAYFTEELEDGVSAYYFEGYGATVKSARITEID
jgi:hypothetical protein